MRLKKPIRLKDWSFKSFCFCYSISSGSLTSYVKSLCFTLLCYVKSLFLSSWSASARLDSYALNSSESSGTLKLKRSNRLRDWSFASFWTYYLISPWSSLFYVKFLWFASFVSSSICFFSSSVPSFIFSKTFLASWEDYSYAFIASSSSSIQSEIKSAWI